MSKEFSENNYQHYLELGGIINEKDYQSALDEVNNKHVFDRGNPQIVNSIRQVVNMARYAGIKLSDSEDTLDSKIVLYLKLHNNQKSDWRSFREVLRMLGDVDALSKLKTACHTNRPVGTYCILCGQTRYSEDCP